MATTLIDSDLHVRGAITATGALNPSASSVINSSISASAAIARSKLAQDTLAIFAIPLTAFRIHDAFQTNLPGTSSGNDLGLVGGTFATASPTLQTADLKSAGATSNYARCLWQLPVEYDDGQTVQIRVFCGMKTTVADVTCTMDVECFESNKIEGIGSDLVTTAATNMNSLTDANLDFTVTAAGLVSGDPLDIRIHVNCNDGSGGTAVIGVVGFVALLCDIKG